LDPARMSLSASNIRAFPPAKQRRPRLTYAHRPFAEEHRQGACILTARGPVPPAMREADIRRALVRKGYIKGIIGLPPNLFTAPESLACIIRRRISRRSRPQGIFHDRRQTDKLHEGPALRKNRLRGPRNFTRSSDVFNRRLEIAKYSHMVTWPGSKRLSKNEFNPQPAIAYD